jgi:hypothetical protein
VGANNGTPCLGGVGADTLVSLGKRHSSLLQHLQTSRISISFAFLRHFNCRFIPRVFRGESAKMSPISRMARMLLILHSIVNIALGIYPFINPEEYSAITGLEGPEKTLQSIGKSNILFTSSHLLVAILPTTLTCQLHVYLNTTKHKLTRTTKGLGAVAVGWYQLIFTFQGNRRMMASTIPLRLGFAAVMYNWERQPVMIYELTVVWFCFLGVFA